MPVTLASGVYALVARQTKAGLLSADSTPVDVTGDRPPTAAAGADQDVREGATVRLDGSGSTDVDGQPSRTRGRRWADRSSP